MPGKEKELVEKTPALKGTAAEKRVLEYINEMNRPFGAADIFANLKGAVAKTAIQKILVNLAEKGEITQKAYGKVLIFVAKQADLDEMPPETSDALGAEEKGLITTNNELTILLKTYNQGENNSQPIAQLSLINSASELNRLRSSPTDSELETSIQEAERTYTALIDQLHPLRSGQPLVTAEELLYVNAEWTRWRAEWVKRRKIFYSLRSIVTDAMLPEERQDLDEMLGIEYDTSEHRALELGPLCTQTR